MTTLYSARWLVPISSPAIEQGAIAVAGEKIAAIGGRSLLGQMFPEADVNDFGDSAIVPGFVNAHSHLELTAMRGFLEREEGDFFAWLRKLTMARLERMTEDDLKVSASWGACEAIRAGITCLGDSSDAAYQSMSALREAGVRGIVFQESFGPDARLAEENLEKLKSKMSRLRELETPLLRAGVSPHAPYTVSIPQLKMTAAFALAEKLPLMMHAAESAAEERFIRDGQGPFAEGLAKRGIPWTARETSVIDYLREQGILDTAPLLAHCIMVSEADLDQVRQKDVAIAHCPKSNAKLGHGRAPLAKFLGRGIRVGLGSDSVASNNVCDLLEEARFAILTARIGSDLNSQPILKAQEALRLATLGGAGALGLEGQVGELKEGCFADFAVVSLAGTPQLPSYDPIDTLIFSSSGRDVLRTVVAGREVYREGRVTTLDEERLRARMKEIAIKLRRS